MAKQYNPTLQDLLKDQLGVNVHPKFTESISIPDGTVRQILKNNPNRVGLTLTNLSSNVVYIWLDNQVAASRGIRLSANGGSVSLNWQYDMMLCINEYWALSVGGASTLSMVEVVTNTVVEGD